MSHESADATGQQETEVAFVGDFVHQVNRSFCSSGTMGP